MYNECVFCATETVLSGVVFVGTLEFRNRVVSSKNQRINTTRHREIIYRRLFVEFISAKLYDMFSFSVWNPNKKTLLVEQPRHCNFHRDFCLAKSLRTT